MIFLNLLALLCLSVTNTFADDYRLFTAVSPIHYIINLTFPESAFQEGESGAIFSGEVIILVRALEDTKEIKLHASHDFIMINSVIVNGTESSVVINPVTDIATVVLSKTFPKDSYFDININYDGKISTNDTFGIYRVSYQKPGNNQSKYLLATQFQPTYARRAFPCFDEPSFKALFDVSVLFPEGYKILFNNDISEQPRSYGGMVYQSFYTTPNMSTYTFALVVSNFSSTQGESVDKAVFKVWSRDEVSSIASRKYAAETGPKILKALGDYIGFNYSLLLSKIDHVAVPEFSSAMENWGLITYREALLLFDENNTVDSMKQTIATTVAHELAHQWFGNLITCKWWSETYLNEGFATYFQYMIMKDLEPTWEIEKYFLVNVLQSALDVDSLEAPALTTEVSTPEEILSHFGDISYQKGGSIIRMMAHIMGEDNFKQAIQTYVSSNSSSLVITSDMLEIFQTHVDAIYSGLPEGITLQNAMLSWIEQPGYPLVTASISGKNLTISQQRFLISDEDTISKWYIPITYAESYGEVNFQSTAPAQWLTPEKPEITVEMEYENKWVILNTYQTGFYRVNYDSNLWSGLSQALLKQNFDNIIEENRAQIVDDLFNLVKINKLKYSEVFKIIEFLKNETGYFTWVPAFKGFQYLWLRVQGHPELQAKLKDHITRLMAAFYNTTSISETRDEVLYTQRQLLGSSWACLLEEKTCVNDVRKVFSETVITNNKRPHKNIRSIVYCNALRYSNDTSDFDRLWPLYNETEDNSQQLIMLQALACSNNQEKLKELLLETVKDNSKIRSKHFVFVYTAVYRTSPAGVKATLEFLPENFQKILEKYPAINIQENLIKNFAVVLTTTGQLEKFKSFIAGTSEFSNDWISVGEKALEIANSNLKWFENHVSDLKTYYSIDDDDNNEDKDDGNNEDKGNDTNYSINIRPMELGLMLLSSYIILHSF